MTLTKPHYYAAGVTTTYKHLWAYGVGTSRSMAIANAVKRAPMVAIRSMYVARVSFVFFDHFWVVVSRAGYEGAVWVHPSHLRSAIRRLRSGDINRVIDTW